MPTDSVGKRPQVERQLDGGLYEKTAVAMKPKPTPLGVGCYHYTTAESPPSILIAVPVMNDAHSETRNATRLPTSLGSPKRPSGCSAPCSSQYSSSVPGEPAAFHARSPCALLIEVRQTVLTRILWGSSSLESAFVRAIPAARLTEVGQETRAGLFATRMRDVDNSAAPIVFHVRDHQPCTTNSPH